MRKAELSVSQNIYLGAEIRSKNCQYFDRYTQGFILKIFNDIQIYKGYVVAQLVEALR